MSVPAIAPGGTAGTSTKQSPIHPPTPPPPLPPPHNPSTQPTPLTMSMRIMPVEFVHLGTNSKSGKAQRYGRYASTYRVCQDNIATPAATTVAGCADGEWASWVGMGMRWTAEAID